MDRLVLLLLQFLLDLQMPENWFHTIGQILNVLFALAIRGYLIFVLVGMMIYATGLSDGLAKSLVALGIALYFGGPLIVNLFGQFSGVETITLESATTAWLQLVGMTDAELILRVSRDGEPFEEVSLLSLSHMDPDGTTGSRDYIPLQGWESGTYAFQAELSLGGKLLESTVEERLEVTSEPEVKVVSWATLGLLIGSSLIVTIITLAIVLYRRRNMLRGCDEGN